VTDLDNPKPSDGWHWESDGKGGWISAPRCHEPTCPDFGSYDFGEGTCPAEHAVAHAEDLPCPCHGKTEAELAAPYALFAFSLPVFALVALLIAVVTR